MLESFLHTAAGHVLHSYRTVTHLWQISLSEEFLTKKLLILEQQVRLTVSSYSHVCFIRSQGTTCVTALLWFFFYVLVFSLFFLFNLLQYINPCFFFFSKFTYCLNCFFYIITVTVYKWQMQDLHVTCNAMNHFFSIPFESVFTFIPLLILYPLNLQSSILRLSS